MTLTRILEPEVMDSPEEASDYNRMDHTEVNRQFVDALLEAGLPGNNLLDVGTGTALIPIELCKRHPTCRVTAIDMANSMLDLACENVSAAGLADRIQLAHVDAKRLPFRKNEYDGVISNSIVHHIPEPIETLREAIRVVRREGLLFFRDLLRPESDESVRSLVARYAGNENAHSRKMFEDSLRAALSLEEMRALIELLGFDQASVVQTSDRHWTWSALKR
jgi:ubiquinone/menaquinone biosynthesis C-methylase UbiE